MTFEELQERDRIRAEKKREYLCRWVEAHKDHVREYKREYQRRWRKAHKYACKVQVVKYAMAHPDKIEIYRDNTAIHRLEKKGYTIIPPSAAQE